MALIGTVNVITAPLANTDTVAYTVPAGNLALVTIVIVNSSATQDAAFVGIKKPGDTAPTYFIEGKPVPAGTSIPAVIDRLVLGSGEELYVKSSGGNLKFLVNGIVERPDPQTVYDVSVTGTPNAIPLGDSQGKLDLSWLPASVDPSQPLILRDGPNGEIQIKDRTTGAIYRIFVDNGTLGIEQVV